MPRITRPQVCRVVREMLPREQFGPEELLLWLEETQLRNERARPVPTRDAAPPAAKGGWSRHLKPVVVVLGERPILNIRVVAHTISMCYCWTCLYISHDDLHE